MRFLITIALIEIFTLAKSQNYSFNPSNIILDTIKSDESVYMHTEIVNLTPDTLWFKWKKVTITSEAQWDYSLCDLGTCYIDIPDSGTMSPAAPGKENAFFSVSLLANNTMGNGIFSFYVYESGKESDGDTVTFMLFVDSAEQEEPTGIFTTHSVSKNIIVYPNPTQSKIYLENIKQANSIRLFNAQGKELLENNINIFNTNNPSIDLSDFANGMYYLLYQAADDKMQVLTIQKN